MLDEHVLAVAAHRIGTAAEGCIALSETEILSKLEGAGAWFGPRGDLEQDERFRQIIPYIVLHVGGKVVTYRRTAKGNESRLHGQLSVGLGGHVSLDDVQLTEGRFDLSATIAASSDREVTEELGGVTVVNRRPWQGLIMDDSHAVSRVHLGVLGLWEISDSAIFSGENVIVDVSLMDPQEVAEAENVEGWSKLAMQLLSQRL